MFTIEAIDVKYRPEINEFIKNEWSGPMIVTLGNLYDSSNLPGFMAVEDGKLLGAVLFQMQGDSCEVAALFAIRQSIGVGRALLDMVVGVAKTHNAKSVWLVTTNDNTQAIRFYQMYGFTLKPPI